MMYLSVNWTWLLGIHAPNSLIAFSVCPLGFSMLGKITNCFMTLSFRYCVFSILRKALCVKYTSAIAFGDASLIAVIISSFRVGRGGAAGAGEAQALE